MEISRRIARIEKTAAWARAYGFVGFADEADRHAAALRRSYGIAR